MLVHAALEQEPDSEVLHTAQALLDPEFEEALKRARSLAITRAQRQRVTIVELWRRGERDRTRVLVREHLAHYPDDLLMSWLAGRG